MRQAGLPLSCAQNPDQSQGKVLLAQIKKILFVVFAPAARHEMTLKIMFVLEWSHTG